MSQKEQFARYGKKGLRLLGAPRFFSLSELLGFSLGLFLVVKDGVSFDILYNSLFDRAFATLGLALVLRRAHIPVFYALVLIVFILPLLYHKYHSRFNPINHQVMRMLSGLLLGYVFSETLFYFLLNNLFYRQAFVTIPFLLGCIIVLSSTLMFLSHEKDPLSLLKRPAFADRAYLVRSILVFLLGFGLILSNLSMAGFAASPPQHPASGFGSDTRSYAVERYQMNYSIPSNFVNQTLPINADNAFHAYVYVPLETGDLSLPISLFLHGIGAYDLDLYYNQMMTMLASQGSVAIFLQYPDGLDLTGTEVNESTTVNNLAFYIRYESMLSGINQVFDQMRNSSSDLADWINERSISFDLDSMLIIGHSYGGGMVPFIASKMIEAGYARKQLLLDHEAPWINGKWGDWETNISNLPINTIVHINSYDRDTRFDQCIPLTIFDLYKQTGIVFRSLDFLITRSDTHGFPHLVATHYLPADPLVDQLTHYSVFRRLDAMVYQLLGVSNGDLTRVNQALPHLMNIDSTFTDMGLWSDGTPVHPLIHSTNPSPSLGSYYENFDKTYCENL